MNILQTQI